MKKLSFQWRATLTMTGLVTLTSLILALIISKFALLQIDQIGSYLINIAPPGSTDGLIQLEITDIFPQVAGQLQEGKNTLMAQSVIWLVVVVAATGAATYFVAGGMLAPLRRVSNKMEAMQAQNLSSPLETPAAEDEIATMVRSFNGMLARLDGAFGAHRRFSASAAHELRTPLAVMQARLQLLGRKEEPSLADYREVTGLIGEQTEKLSELVGVLLEMTELESMERGQQISLQAVVEEVLCDVADVAETRGVSLSQSGSGTVMGSDVLVYRAIYNLVENGIKHGRAQGAVAVGITESGGRAQIAVSDDGPGMEESSWEELFTPYVRLETARKNKIAGVGLGLALVREIAEVHGGEVRVAASSPGGTTVLLDLPSGAELP